MIKKLALVIVLIVLLVVAGGIYFVFHIDGIAKDMLVDQSEKATQADTQVDSVHVGLLDGDVNVNAYELANPEGYSETHALKFNNLALQVDGRTVFDPIVIVPLIEITDVDVNLEAKGLKTNVSKILENIQQYGKSDTPAEPDAQKKGKSFKVQQVIIRNTTANVNINPIGEIGGLSEMTKLTVKVPEIKLDMSKEREQQASDLIAQIIPAVIAAVTEKAGDNLPADLRNVLNGDLSGVADALGGEAEKLIDDAMSDVTGELKKKLGDELGDQVGEELGEEAKKAVGEGLKGLLD